jgi:choline dehydrogenase-like flavoprotein
MSTAKTIPHDPLYDGIHEYPEYTGPLNLTAEVVVIGSGPTGALAAYNFAAAGVDTILLESGPVRRPHEFTLDGGRTLAEVAYEGGLRALQGRSILPTIQGRVLGGSSHINSAMTIRTPQLCFDDWKESFGVNTITRQSLDPHYDRIEKFLGIRPTEEAILGPRNLLFKKACDVLGYSSEPTPRNVVGCDGCAECFTGCPTRAKRSMDITYVPEGIKKGLRVYTSIETAKVDIAAGRATGVSGFVVHPRTNARSHAVSVKAKHVVLAAGCLATPVILQKSAAPDPYKLIGEGLQGHPGAAMMGLFEDEVNPWFGATQGYHSLHFVPKGFKLEVLWSPPAILAVRLPGLGLEFKSALATFKHGAVWDAIFSCKKSKGRVKAKGGANMNPSVSYNVDQSDMPLVREGMATILRMFFAAGAKKVYPGIYGMPHTVSDPKSVDDLLKMDLKPQDLVLASTHLFSSTRMGSDPKASVVDETGEMHHLKGCYIVDTGVFPRSPAVNPMLTGMAIADVFSGLLIEKLGKGAATV